MEKFTTKNVYFYEGIKRIIIGVSVASLFFVGPQTPAALVFGLYAIVTGLLLRCPIYALFDINTREDEHEAVVEAPKVPERTAPTQVHA